MIAGRQDDNDDARTGENAESGTRRETVALVALPPYGGGGGSKSDCDCCSGCDCCCCCSSGCDCNRSDCCSFGLETKERPPLILRTTSHVVCCGRVNTGLITVSVDGATLSLHIGSAPIVLIAPSIVAVRVTLVSAATVARVALASATVVRVTLASAAAAATVGCCCCKFLLLSGTSVFCCSWLLSAA